MRPQEHFGRQRRREGVRVHEASALETIRLVLPKLKEPREGATSEDQHMKRGREISDPMRSKPRHLLRGLNFGQNKALVDLFFLRRRK